MSGNKKLGELCNEMLNQGYNYASFYDINGKDDILLEKPIDVSSKPTKGIYFSKLKNYNAHMSLSKSSQRMKTREESYVYPEWYNFIINTDYELKKYEHRGIIFAKIDESKLKNIKDIKAVHECPVGFQILSEYNWGKISECGVLVNDRNIIDKNRWDIEQCIIWDENCFIKYKIFKNSSKRVSYTPVDCKIKNKDISVQVAELVQNFNSTMSNLLSFKF